jgi:hypothetical protein
MLLPYSGQSATIRRPTGRDMVEAERLAGKDAGSLTIQLAILSRVTSIEGRVLPYEDFLTLDAEDLDFLGKQEIKKPPPPSPPNQSSDYQS